MLTMSRYRYATIKANVTIIVTATISVVNATFLPKAIDENLCLFAGTTKENFTTCRLIN